MKALVLTAAVFVLAGIAMIASTASSNSSDGAAPWLLFIGGCLAILIGIGTGIAALAVRASNNKRT